MHRLDHGDLRNLYESDQHEEDALIPQAIRTWRSAAFSGPEQVTIRNPSGPSKSDAIFQSVSSEHIESDISERRFNLREVIGETRRPAPFEICAPGEPKICVYDSGIPILSGVCPILSQGYFTALWEPVARGLSTWRKRVVHASYTWFMDRGPYSDVPSDTRPMERSE